MPTKIEDFGEKFWGARKDLWHQRGLLFSDLEGANPSEKAKYAIKSNVIPKLDYKKMKEDGYSVNVLYFYKMVIDSLPTKPHYRGNHVYSNGQMNFEYENEDEDINNFIDLLTNVKQTLLENVKTDEDIDSFYDKLNPVLFDVNHIVKDGYKTLVRESNLLSVSQAGLRRVKGAVLEKQFLMTAEEIERARYEIYLYDNEHVTFEKDAYNGDKEYLAIRSIGYSRFFHRVGIPSNEWKENTYFVTYGNFLIRGINYSTREEALTKIDEFIKEDLAKDAEESKKTSNRKKNFTPSGVENIERKANFDWLQDDATPEKYLNEFKFRGGEFGNWENQKERQINLNHAYNSFSDIALALGISLESVSGNGKLGIAFGSRGHSRAAAHYEPDSDVINLTRMNGAGALGHEWGHFFDHLIGDGRFASESYKMPEMKELMQIMKYKDEPIKEDDFNEQKNKDIQRYLKGLNQYIDNYFPGKDSYTVEQLQKKTNLINALKEDATKNPDSYLYFSFGTRDEPKALVDLSNYKNELTGRVIPKDNRKDIANYCQWYGNASSRTFDSTLTKRVSTEYYKGSIYFDDNYSHSGHDYWKSDVELFARAFQCYLKDKLTEANITNDYLCGYADGYIMMDSKGEYHRAYPYGEERKLINDAFDKLIAKVKEDNVFVQSKNWEHLKNVVVLENEAQMDEFKNQNEYATINEPLTEEKDNDFNLSLPEWYLNEYGERIKEFKEITGNLNYENTIKNYIHEALINADVDIKFNDIKVALYGSKIFGDNHDYNHGDIDILVEFNETDNFDVSEDTLFNILNDVPDDEKLYLGNLVADFNPILASKSGDIEEHLLNAKKYWQEKTNEVDDVFDVNYVKENTEMLNPDKPNEHIRNLFDLINEEPVKQEEPKIIPYNIENFEINYELSDGTYFHFHTNEEGYYYSILNSEGAEVDGGLMEYSMPFEDIETLQSVMERLSDFTGIKELKNSDLKEVSQDYIDELENKYIERNTTKIKMNSQAPHLEFKYSTDEINDYINTVVRDEIISIGNGKYGLRIHEDYIEPSYEWFVHDISSIELISVIDDNHYASVRIFDWLKGTGNELKPTKMDGFESLMKQIIKSPNNFTIPDNIYSKLVSNEKDEIRRIKEDDFGKKLYLLDKTAPFSIEYGEVKKYFLYFDNEGRTLSQIVNYLESKSGEEYQKLLSEAKQYLEIYSPDAYRSSNETNTTKTDLMSNGDSQIDLNVETAINNLGFIYDNEISKTIYYESLNDESFKDKYITPKLLKNDTIEYFYDQETNLLLFQTWNDENVIIPCTKENIDKIGVQLFYKVSNNPNYSETEHKKENQKELNNKELNLVAPDKKLEYLSRIASTYLSQARYGDVAIELNYSHKDLDKLDNLKNVFNHLYDYSIAHTNAYNDKETLAFYNKAINDLSSDKAQLALNNSIAPISEKDMSLDNKLSTNVEELTNMYRMWSNSETRYEDVIEPSSLYFKFDKLMQDASTEDWASENRIKLIAFFKDMRNKALSFVDFNKLTPEELNTVGQSDIVKNKVANELTFFKDKRELYKTLATFNSTKYTFNNSLLIHSQCRVKGLNAELTNTFDSWKQNQNTSVLAGSKAMMIIQPKETVEYYEYCSNDMNKRLPNTHDKAELSKYENMVKDKKGYKRINKEFVLLPRIFSVDQTKLSQSEKDTLLMNKNASATEDVISKDINRLNNISKLLPISLNELDNKTSEAKVWSNLVEIGNHLFKPEKPEGVNKVDLEIKSNLFANIICEGLGINSIDASDDNLDISGLSNSLLLSQLHSIEPAVKLVGSMLMSDNIADYQAYQLKNFTLNPQKNKYVGKVK